MHKRNRILGILSVLLILGLVLVLKANDATASIPPATTLSTQVSPEPYPDSNVYPAQVYLAASSDLQILYRLEIDIEGLAAVDGAPYPGVTAFRPSYATVYINPEQSVALARAGLNPVPIRNQGYRSYLAYGPGSDAPDAWPTFAEYVTRMQNLEAAYPDLVKLIQIGTSVQGRSLYCMEITDNAGVAEDEPEFKYTANHHGDETTGVELTMRLAELLASSYGSDPAITALVDHMEIWLCPIYNPDGYTNGTRYNYHGVDLNRDFPDRFTDPVDDPTGREPETQAFMNFGYAHRFVMGANYHGGAQVLNYPWDAVDGPPYYAPDDQLFFDFGYGYTSQNIDLWNGGWPYGMTRGWEWYYVYGGMQDWAYYYHGEHHVTLEISDTKMPPYTQMDTYWSHNRAAMLWWMQRGLTGVSGLVLDKQENTPLDAKITLVGREVPNTVLTDPQVGDYHRVISAGDYQLQAEAQCHQSQIAQVSVISGTVTTQDFLLEPIIDLSSSEKTVSVNHSVPGNSIEYQLNLKNSCSPTSAIVTDTLPSQVTWTGYLTATSGTVGFEAGQVTWQGEISQAQSITITYGVSLNQCLPAGTTIVNLAEIEDSVDNTITRTVQVKVDNSLPSIPGSPFPLDGAVDQPITTTLSWSPSGDLNCDLVIYTLYFDTNNPPRTHYDVSNPSFDPGVLDEGTTYYWYVSAYDGIAWVKGPLWSFTTSNEVPGEPLKIFLPLAQK